MEMFIARHPSAALLASIGRGLHAVAITLHATAERLDQWLARRKRAAEDLDALASMSERELRDIGIRHASIESIAHLGWTGDLTR